MTGAETPESSDTSPRGAAQGQKSTWPSAKNRFRPRPSWQANPSCPGAAALGASAKIAAAAGDVIAGLSSVPSRRTPEQSSKEDAMAFHADCRERSGESSGETVDIA